MKKTGVKSKVQEAFVTVSIALILFFLFATFLEFSTKNNVYIESGLQQFLFYPSFLVSFFLLANFLLRREWVKAILAFLLPLLVYDFINYTVEAVRVTTEAYKILKEGVNYQTQAEINQMLSLADLKIVFTILSLTIWCWVWLKLREER